VTSDKDIKKSLSKVLSIREYSQPLLGYWGKEIIMKAYEYLNQVNPYYNERSAKFHAGEIPLGDCSLLELTREGDRGPCIMPLDQRYSTLQGWRKAGPKQMVWLLNNQAYIPESWSAYTSLMFDSVIFHETNPNSGIPDDPKHPKLFVPSMDWSKEGKVWELQRWFLSNNIERRPNIVRMWMLR